MSIPLKYHMLDLSDKQVSIRKMSDGTVFCKDFSDRKNCLEWANYWNWVYFVKNGKDSSSIIWFDPSQGVTDYSGEKIDTKINTFKKTEIASGILNTYGITVTISKESCEYWEIPYNDDGLTLGTALELINKWNMHSVRGVLKFNNNPIIYTLEPTWQKNT